MLATLNLQLSPVELLDDTLTTSASLLPDAGIEAESGFADLLRLRVDASVMVENPSGALLPEGGSDLPVLAENVAADLALEAPPKLDPGLVKLMPSQVTDSGPMALSERPDIVLETPVLYPPAVLDPVTSRATADVRPSANLPSVPALMPRADGHPESGPAGIVAEDGDTPTTFAARQLSTPGLQAANLEVGARLEATLAALSERKTTAAPAFSVREHGQFEPSRARTPLQNPAGESIERLALTDVVKRTEIVPLLRTDGVGKVGAELIQPQPLQTPQLPLNAQPSQALFIAPPNAATVADVTYATAAQSTDLIATPVRDSAWGEQIGERVLLMASKQLNSAEIRLTPAELGPLRVRVSVEDGAANVTFHAQHAVTREAIEQALPRLREMLAENGLTLGQADVGEQGVAQGNKDSESDGRVANPTGDEAESAVAEDNRSGVRNAKIANGLVDTFA